MRAALPVALLCSTLSSPVLAASPESQAFGQCLIGKTTGDDRLLLARWMTFAFASHPVVQDALTIDEAKLPETDQEMADLVTDLVAERCVNEAKAAVAAEGDPGIAMQKAFEMLGMVASQEVLRDAAAQDRINAFATFIDETRLGAALTP